MHFADMVHILLIVLRGSLRSLRKLGLQLCILIIFMLLAVSKVSSGMADVNFSCGQTNPLRKDIFLQFIPDHIYLQSLYTHAMILLKFYLGTSLFVQS